MVSKSADFIMAIAPRDTGITMTLYAVSGIIRNPMFRRSALEPMPQSMVRGLPFIFESLRSNPLPQSVRYAFARVSARCLAGRPPIEQRSLAFGLHEIQEPRFNNGGMQRDEPLTVGGL